jgi:hypothetical protein
LLKTLFMRTSPDIIGGMFPAEQIADSYLRHYMLKDERDFRAFEEVNRIVRRDPAAGWR